VNKNQYFTVFTNKGRKV